MSICFYTNENIKEVSRKRANGYKSICIDDTVQIPSMVEVVSEDVDSDRPVLRIKAIKDTTKVPDKYMFLCKEFGLLGFNADFTSKISVMFCDNGYMLITLHKGMLLLQNDKDITAFVVGSKLVPQIDAESILWKSSEDLMSFVRYRKDKSEYIYDFDFMFEVKGGKVANMGNFRLKPVLEEDRDMSLGAYVVLAEKVNPEQLQEKEKSEKAQEKIKRDLNRYFSRNK